MNQVTKEYCCWREKVEVTWKSKSFLGFEWWEQVSEKDFDETQLFIAYDRRISELPTTVRVNNQLYVKQK